MGSIFRENMKRVMGKNNRPYDDPKDLAVKNDVSGQIVEEAPEGGGGGEATVALKRNEGGEEFTRATQQELG